VDQERARSRFRAQLSARTLCILLRELSSLRQGSSDYLRWPAQPQTRRRSLVFCSGCPRGSSTFGCSSRRRSREKRATARHTSRRENLVRDQRRCPIAAPDASMTRTRAGKRRMSVKAAPPKKFTMSVETAPKAFTRLKEHVPSFIDRYAEPGPRRSFLALSISRFAGHLATTRS